jgi:hypothetical protein
MCPGVKMRRLHPANPAHRSNLKELEFETARPCSYYCTVM